MYKSIFTFASSDFNILFYVYISFFKYLMSNNIPLKPIQPSQPNTHTPIHSCHSSRTTLQSTSRTKSNFTAILDTANKNCCNFGHTVFYKLCLHTSRIGFCCSGYLVDTSRLFSNTHNARIIASGHKLLSNNQFKSVNDKRLSPSISIEMD